MAAVKNRTSPWFKSMAGSGWRCQKCGRYNSRHRRVTCVKCRERRPTADDYAKQSANQKEKDIVEKAASNEE
jgi:hypothetical protein